MDALIMPATSAAVLLAALAYLAVKHWIADFVLQTDKQRREKGIYGAAGGLTHSGTHAALTAPVFAILSVPVAGAAAILLAEFVVHYHIDWAKEQAVHRYRWTTNDAAFWHAFGFDQLLHALTYLAIVAAALFWV